MRCLFIKCIKFYPIVINIYILIIMVLATFGIRISLYDVFGQSYAMNFLLFSGSIIFSFCLWHRLLIVSMTSILCMESLYRLGLKIESYSYICVLIVLFTIVLSSILYYKNGCYHENKIKRSVS